MSPAAAAGCPFSHCCLWSELCSPLIPRVDPGREYASMPTDADDSPARSVLVGIMATSGGDRSLRLHRFGVAGSGSVIGRSGGALETLGDGYYRPKTPTSHIRAASGSSDGRPLSLCIFSREADFSDPKVSKVAPPIPLQLQMDLGAADDKGITVSRLPGLPPEVGPLMPTCPSSAAGELWAPYLTGVYGQSSLVMQRFDKDAAKWVKGYVVIGDTILLSLWPFHLFYTFNCSTCAWAAVATSKKDGMWMYAPIRERGVYVEEDDTIYFFCDAVVYAYKLRKDQDRYQMAPPTTIGRVCPFSHEGYGFLSYLGGRVMCSVWIGVKLPCNCDAKHVLITTFRVKGDGSEHFVPKGVKVLHSTCHRLDMAPSKSLESYLEFSFLQEYKEFNHENATPPAKRRRGDVMESSMLLEDMEVPASFNVVKSSNMPACCRFAIYCLKINFIEQYMFQFDFIFKGNINHIDSTRPVGVKFRLVVLVGINVVAISGTLQDVYHLSQGKWMCHKTSRPPDLDKEVCLSGYVVLSSSTFMVSDAEENHCFLHDIVNDKWTIVKPLKPSGWPVRACLSERCVFAKGFIYTCSDWGLAAFELVEQGGSYYLGEQVDLQFSWLNYWERNRMCLEYVGEDTSSGAIMFCVAKDDQICQPGYPRNEKPVRITTVQVKTEEMPDGKLKPKSIGHVTSFVQGNGGAIWTRDCFAAADIQA
ncbi:unnamed protein product [Miscanthus lutarioriparius]|uniref:Uncharacterized protein n=1 Tax=Miscanthus lutarioriparius TaxID=422564 RepID=A0A811MEQ4_9POAL|nr:unnamed protein product [Miscanthus lutarioriparius]